MKIFKTFFFASTILLLCSFVSGDKSFPKANIKTLDGHTVEIYDYIAKGKPVVISFWASWCSPCKRELDAISDIYEDWQEEYDVEVIAITTDNARGLAKVPGIVATKSWPYTVLCDTKQDLQRALNFQTIPQTFLLDGEGNIVYSHNGYNPGDEYELEDHIKEIAK